MFIPHWMQYTKFLILQAIVKPLAPKSGRVSVLLAILSIWAVSGALAAPAAESRRAGWWR